MKKIKLIALFVPLLIGGILASTVSAQRISRPDYESSYFDREDYISADGDTTVSLYEKGNRFKPEQIHPGQVVPGLKKMSKEALRFFKREFPDLSYPEDLYKLGKVMLCMYVDHEGNIISYYYRLKSDELSLYPDMEKHLYNIAMSIKNEGLKKYDIYAINPDTYYPFNFHFVHIYRALVLPEKAVENTENRPKSDQQP